MCCNFQYLIAVISTMPQKITHKTAKWEKYLLRVPYYSSNRGKWVIVEKRNYIIHLLSFKHIAVNL
jgi:hypothetical protein